MNGETREDAENSEFLEFDSDQAAMAQRPAPALLGSAKPSKVPSQSRVFHFNKTHAQLPQIPRFPDLAQPSLFQKCVHLVAK